MTPSISLPGDTSGAVVCQVACPRHLPTAWTASTGQMAHIMVGSSVSHVRLRKKVERGAVVTGHELCFFFAFGLQMLAVIVPRASILESRCAQPFSPGAPGNTAAAVAGAEYAMGFRVPWSEGCSRCAVAWIAPDDATELSRTPWLVVIPAPVTCAYTCNCSLESGLLG